MRRLVLLLAVVSGTVLLGACGSGEVVVQAQLEGETAGTGAAEPVVLSDLPIYLLPYDRDAIFDSLQATFPEPEPEIPDSLLALQQEIAAAQEEWKQAEAEWTVVRDSLKQLSDAMEGLSRAQPEYVALFSAFQELEPREQALNRATEEAFNRFTELQSRFAQASEQIKLERAQWADEAFAPVDSIIFAKLDELDREEYADTTDATGAVRLQVPPGKWWVHARYELPYRELYWNVPVEVTKGEPLELRLTRENAEVRPKL